MKVFCCHGNKSTILLNFIIRFLEQFLKCLVNFSLLKSVKSERSYGFLNHKRADFLASKFWTFYHFSTSLNILATPFEI